MIFSAPACLSKSEIVNEGPSLITAIVLNASVDVGNVEIYDGLDDVSGRLIFDVHGWANNVNGFPFPHPVLCTNGIYVKFVANVHRCTINYVPLRGEPDFEVYPGFIIE